jgi:hypothetical protein
MLYVSLVRTTLVVVILVFRPATAGYLEALAKNPAVWSGTPISAICNKL